MLTCLKENLLFYVSFFCLVNNFGSFYLSHHLFPQVHGGTSCMWLPIQGDSSSFIYLPPDRRWEAWQNTSMPLCCVGQHTLCLFFSCESEIGNAGQNPIRYFERKNFPLPGTCGWMPIAQKSCEGDRSQVPQEIRSIVGKTNILSRARGMDLGHLQT